MINYEDAFKKPFSDFKKLALAIILNILPIVNFIVYGYLLEIARSSAGKKPGNLLPEWKNYGSLFLNGLFSFIIGLFYLLPFFIVMAIAFAMAKISIFSYMSNGSLQGITPAIASLGLWALLLLILLLATTYVLPSAIMSYALSGEISSAFEFGNVVKKAMTQEYFVVWLISIVYTAILSSLLALIPYVGGAAAGAITGITMFTLLGQIYPRLTPKAK